MQYLPAKYVSGTACKPAMIQPCLVESTLYYFQNKLRRRWKCNTCPRNTSASPQSLLKFGYVWKITHFSFSLFEGKFVILKILGSGFGHLAHCVWKAVMSVTRYSNPVVLKLFLSCPTYELEYLSCPTRSPAPTKLWQNRPCLTCVF